MDKRTLIAVLLTFIVLVAWQVLYVGPKQKELLQKKRAADSLMSARSDSLTGRAGEGAGEEDPAPEAAEPDEDRIEEGARINDRMFSTDAPPVEITVRTGAMRVVLNSLDADITEVELAGYERRDDGNVQLIPEGGAGGLSISIFDGASWRRIADTGHITTVDGRRIDEDEEIVLSADSPQAKISFVLEEPAGGRIEKSFTC